MPDRDYAAALETANRMVAMIASAMPMAPGSMFHFPAWTVTETTDHPLPNGPGVELRASGQLQIIGDGNVTAARMLPQEMMALGVALLALAFEMHRHAPATDTVPAGAIAGMRPEGSA